MTLTNIFRVLFFFSLEWKNVDFFLILWKNLNELLRNCRKIQAWLSKSRIRQCLNELLWMNYVDSIFWVAEIINYSFSWTCTVLSTYAPLERFQIQNRRQSSIYWASRHNCSWLLVTRSIGEMMNILNDALRNEQLAFEQRNVLRTWKQTYSSLALGIFNHGIWLFLCMKNRV